MKLLGTNDETPDAPSSNRPQIRSLQEDGGVGAYGFSQENEFPTFVQKRWPGNDDAMDVRNLKIFLYSSQVFQTSTLSAEP